MKLIKKYFKIVNQIYDYFGYESGKKVLPIEDYTEFKWYYSEDEGTIYYNSINDESVFPEIGTIYYGVYDDSEMVLFEIADDALLIFDAKKEIYIDE